MKNSFCRGLSGVESVFLARSHNGAQAAACLDFTVGIVCSSRYLIEFRISTILRGTSDSRPCHPRYL
jgi:hypothetical protein